MARKIDRPRHSRKKSEPINFARIIIVVIIGIIFFLGISYFVRHHLPFFENIIRQNTLLGMGVLFLAAVLDVVLLAFVVPLLPIASNVFGVWTTFFLLYGGWFTGTIIAFWIGRRWGRRVVKYIIPLKKIDEFEAIVAKQHPFWFIIFLRLFIPLDIVSYTLGIMKHIRFRTYLIAGAIGMLPASLLFAYVGGLSLFWEVIALGGALIVIIVIGVLYHQGRIVKH